MLFEAHGRILVLLHVYYPSVCEQMWPYLLHLRDAGIPHDLYVSLVEDRVSPEWRVWFHQHFPYGQYHLVPNRGMDVGGTVRLLEFVNPNDYKLVLKIHTKRDDAWRNELLDAILANPVEILRLFEQDRNVSMAACSRRIMSDDRNLPLRHKLAARLQVPPYLVNMSFVAGTMFWCRPVIMNMVKAAQLRQTEFEPGYANDGLLAHAMERMFGSLAGMTGYIARL